MKKQIQLPLIRGVSKVTNTSDRPPLVTILLGLQNKDNLKVSGPKYIYLEGIKSTKSSILVRMNKIIMNFLRTDSMNMKSFLMGNGVFPKFP